MTVRESMVRWIDPETGMIQAADGGRDNLVLHTARLARRLSPGERQEIRPTVERFFKSCEVPGWPGLLRRFPGHLGEGSVDNLIGAVLLSRLLDLGYEHKILNHAREHFWVFNTESPGNIRWSGFGWWKDWYWKHAGVPPLVKVACGEALSAFDRAAFSGSLDFLMLFNRGTTDLLLQDDINALMRGIHPRTDEAIAGFDRWVTLNFGGMEKVNETYYGIGHPFALYPPQDTRYLTARG